MTENVLVIGGAGYVGTALVSRILHDTENNVTVLDNLLYGGDSLLPFFNFGNRFSFVKGDIRTIDPEPILEKTDRVVNLAALVGEPLCKKFPKQATEINLDANLKMANLSEKNNVKQFIFSSTCSNYGLSNNEEAIDENGKLQPISLYAETKVQSEHKLLNDYKKMQTTVLRFATAYGLSSRVRFDLLLHQFIKDAWIDKKIVVYGANSWRPMAHVDDIARAIVLVLSKTFEKNAVYNVGSNNQNFQKNQLAEMVASRLNATVENLSTIKDPRNYKVSFDKIKNELGYNTIHDPKNEIDKISAALEMGVITEKHLIERVNIQSDSDN